MMESWLGPTSAAPLGIECMTKSVSPKGGYAGVEFPKLK